MKLKLLSLLFCGSLMLQSLAAQDAEEFVGGNWYDPNTIQNDCCADETFTCQEFCLQTLLNPYLQHIEGKGVGYDCGYSTLGVFVVPKDFKPFCIQPFLDIRGHCFNNSKGAFNVGAGGRYFCEAINRVIGVGLYYDFRRVRKVDLSQVGLSLEVLGCHYDLRINGYLPVGRRHFFGHKTSFLYDGGFFATVREYRRTLSGIDGEIYSNLRRWCPCTNFDIYAGAGPYWYRRDFGLNIVGGRVRLGIEYRCFTIEGRVTYDNHFKTIVQGLISLVIPLSDDGCPCRNITGSSCYSIDDLMVQPVYRQEILPTSRKSLYWQTNF